MDDLVSLRHVQLLVALGYALIGALALARQPDGWAALFALGLLVGAWATGRRLPDGYVPRRQWWRVAGVGVLLIAVGLVMLALGRGLEALPLAMAYGTGNRLKAGGFPKARAAT